MKRKKRMKPTQSELEILKVLWDHGPSTVKLVNEIQNKDKEVGYTTTLKIMQIMVEKDMLKRRKQGRGHVYRPVLKQEKMQEQLLDSFLDSAFSGSAAKLAMHALGTIRPTKEEISQIRELLDRIEKGEEK